MDINLAKKIFLLSSPRKQWGKTWVFQYSPESGHHTVWAYYYTMKAMGIWQVINQKISAVIMYEWRHEIDSIRSQYYILSNGKPFEAKNLYLKNYDTEKRQEIKYFFLLNEEL